MTPSHTPRTPISHRTSTTSQRLQHGAHCEEGMDWGAIGKILLISVLGFALLYCAAAAGF